MRFCEYWRRAKSWNLVALARLQSIKRNLIINLNSISANLSAATNLNHHQIRNWRSTVRVCVSSHSAVCHTCSIYGLITRATPDISPTAVALTPPQPLTLSSLSPFLSRTIYSLHSPFLCRAIASPALVCYVLAGDPKSKSIEYAVGQHHSCDNDARYLGERYTNI